MQKIKEYLYTLLADSNDQPSVRLHLAVFFASVAAVLAVVQIFFDKDCFAIIQLFVLSAIGCSVPSVIGEVQNSDKIEEETLVEKILEAQKKTKK